MKKSETYEDTYDNEDYVTLENRLLFTTSENSIKENTYKGYGNFSNWIKNSVNVAKDFGIKNIQTHKYDYEYFSTYNSDTINYEKFLIKFCECYEKLSFDDQQKLTKKYNFDEHEYGFAKEMLQVYKACNDNGIIQFL
ncbi:MAG: hypothetical protein CMF62_00995 [Magnetococcales bacterium]|nr:hypothetical protein [Magnetococcales bacterium]